MARWRWGGLVVGVWLSACQAGQQGAPTPTRPAPNRPVGAAVAASPSPPGREVAEAPSVGPAVRASALPSGPEATASGPSLPLRLGLALPGSLVGQAQARLAGEGGLVAREGTRLVAGVGGLIISNNSGTLMGNNGGSILSNNSGALISDQGSTYRLAPRALAQAEAPLVQFPDDRRFVLWEQLVFIDLADQLLQAYAEAGPSLDAWVPFELRPVLLPPPQGSPIFNAFIQNAFAQVAPLPYLGKLVREGEGLRLWLVRLPKAGAKASEGEVALDLQAPAQGSAVTRFACPLEFREMYGLVGGAMRVELLSEGGLRFRSGDRSRPWAEMSAQTRVLVSARQPYARHRQGLIRLQPSGAAELRVAEAQRTVLAPPGQEGPWGVRFIRAFGFAGPGQSDAGIAFWQRSGEGPPSDDIPLQWTLGGQAVEGPIERVQAEYLDAVGSAPASPAPSALQSLLPAWKPEDEGLIPRMPTLADRLDLDPELAPQKPPAAILQGP